MTEPRFNLVDEPWIRAVLQSGEEEKFSIRDLIRNAGELRFLSGETPLQNTAVLRFLVALNVTVLYRYDENGAASAITNRSEALRRFKKVWDAGGFPVNAYSRYFDEWHDRFYLIGGERPFYQVPDNKERELSVPADKKNPSGVTFLLAPYRDSDKLGWLGAAALNGEVLESANSPSPFSNIGEKDRNVLTLDEAARWLLYYMSYADCSSKIPGKWNAGKTFASGGANIYPSGEDLFHTVMLCSVLTDQNNAIYENILPAWENDLYTEINFEPYGDGFPANLPELYTQQSRKVILHINEDNLVDGAFVAAGDRYGTENAFIDPMFAFHQSKKDKNSIVFLPNHIMSNSAWKEFKNIFAEQESTPARWSKMLFAKEIIPDDANVPFLVSDIEYRGMSCGIKSVCSSGIIVNKKFFMDTDEMFNAREEIERINEITGILGRLGDNIEKTQGKDVRSSGKLAKKLKDEYESHISERFCLYLINKVSREELRTDEVKKARRIAENALADINIVSITGHGEYSIGSAENEFYRDIKKYTDKQSREGSDLNE